MPGAMLVETPVAHVRQEAPTHIPQNVLSATYPPSDGQSLADPRQAGEQHASQRHEEATSFEPPSRGISFL